MLLRPAGRKAYPDCYMKSASLAVPKFLEVDSPEAKNGEGIKLQQGTPEKEPPVWLGHIAPNEPLRNIPAILLVYHLRDKKIFCDGNFYF
jgi:hypothetical protein